MNTKYLEHIAKLDLKAYEYKILLLLQSKTYTGSQLAHELNLINQNANRYIQNLRRMGLIELDRIEGRNKFYKAVIDVKKLSEVLPGQLKIE